MSSDSSQVALQRRLRNAILTASSPSVVSRLLVAKASVSGPVDDEGGSPTLPLVLAAYKGRARVATLLLAAGADAAAADAQGRTARDVALRRAAVARLMAPVLLPALTKAKGAADDSQMEEEDETEAEWCRRALANGADEGDTEEMYIGNLDEESDGDSEDDARTSK
jgi:ankyrin repeat protein